MDWWCSSTRQVWTWTPRPYLGSLLIVASVIALAGWWHLRGRHHDPIVAAKGSAVARAGTGAEIRGTSTGRSVALVCGVLLLWACIDWPLAALGAGYLATAQMFRQIVMIMVVAPLLLFACPPALAARAIGWGKRLTVLRLTARPAFSVPFAALSLLAVASPALVDPLVTSQWGTFAMDAIWVAAGFVLWMPVQCPHPGVRRLQGGAVMVYLVAQSIVPVLPGFFMTWADFPLYAAYESAPRVIAGFDAVTDQQTAAAVLQVGGMVLLWSQIAYRFLKWGYEQADDGRTPRKAMAGADALTP